MVETLGRRELREGELVAEGGVVEIQQQEEIAGQKEALRRPAIGDERDLVAADGTDDPEDNEATETLPATQLEIEKHVFRLRAIRARQLADARQRQLSTKSHGVNIQTGVILDQRKTICGCQCYGRIAIDPLETWSHR